MFETLNEPNARHACDHLSKAAPAGQAGHPVVNKLCTVILILATQPVSCIRVACAVGCVQQPERHICAIHRGGVPHHHAAGPRDQSRCASGGSRTLAWRRHSAVIAVSEPVADAPLHPGAAAIYLEPIGEA